MSVFFKRCVNGRCVNGRCVNGVRAVVCLLAVLACPGCEWLLGGGLLRRPHTPGDATATADSPPGMLSFLAGKAAVVSDADRELLARSVVEDATAGSQSVWIRDVPPADADPARPHYRWRYPDLEELLAEPPGRRPDLRPLLADADPVVAANSAIALARLRDAAGTEQLVAAVRTRNMTSPMRCAAAEALASLPASAAVPRLRELIDQYGVVAPGSRAPYRAELHAELIRGLARHVEPAADPRFVAALQSRSTEVLLTALEAWSAGGRGTLPDEAVDLRGHGNREVRMAALGALARHRHPQAHEYLAAALHDHDFQVCVAAIEAMGRLGGAEARATLEPLLGDRLERTRRAAVFALAELGAKRAVLDAAGDESWRVRMEVARALAHFPDRDGAAAAGDLLGDPSAEVQRHVVQAVAEWPPQLAGPVLLEAMDSLAYKTRSMAAEQLAARWPPSARFPIDGSQQHRSKALEELTGLFRQQFGFVDRTALDAAAAGRQTATVTPEQVARVEQLVRQGDIGALAAYGPPLVEALERLVFDRHQVLPEAIYRHVLPRSGPVFDALDRMTSSDLAWRRRAVGELVGLAAEQPLGRLAVARLARLVASEDDQLVWQSALAAVSRDPSEPAIRLAYAAIGHPSPEVRRRACRNLAAHPDPRHVKVLLPTLEDRSHSVVCDAVRALGRCGRMDDTRPLKRMLLGTNEPLRLETAIALSRLGDPAGPTELQRLAYSADPTVRRGVAEAMGELPRPAYVATLIRLLDDRLAVSRMALESLPKVAGGDPSLSADGPAANTPQRVRRWKQWFERQAGIPSPPGPQR